MAAGLLAGCLLGGATGSAAAQAGFFGHTGGPYMDGADLQQADAAAHRLLDPKPAPAGAVETWSEPGSGDSGTLTMGRSYRAKGRNCRAVEWRELFKNGDQRDYALNTCKVAGTWKLM